MWRVFIVCAVFLFFLSCLENENTDLLASFEDKKLVLSDVIYNMPKEIEDSSYFIQTFVDDWIRREIMLSYAEMNLSIDLSVYEEQVEEYRSSLLIYAYQQELLNQNIDTAIPLVEIQDYYEQHKEEFILSQDIFKGRLVIVDKSAPNIKKIAKWYKSNKEKEILDLRDYCQQFAKEYHLDDNIWQDFSMVNSKLPDFIQEEEYFLRNTKTVFFDDEVFRYFIFVKDFKLKGSVSPFIFSI